MEVNAEGLLLTISETPGEGVSGGVSVGMSVAEMTLTTTAASDAVREGSSAASCAPGGTSVLPGRKRGAGAAPAAGSVEHYAAEVAAAASLAAAEAAEAARVAEETAGQYMDAAPDVVVMERTLKCAQAADAAVVASEAALEAASCAGSAASAAQAAKRPRQQGNRYAVLASDDAEMCEAGDGVMEALAERRAQVIAEAEAKAASAEAAAAEVAARKEAGKAQRARVAVEGVKKFNQLRGVAAVENFLCVLQEGGRDFFVALRVCLAALATEDVRVAAAERAATAERAAAAERFMEASVAAARLSAAMGWEQVQGVGPKGAKRAVTFAAEAPTVVSPLAQRADGQRTPAAEKLLPKPRQPQGQAPQRQVPQTEHVPQQEEAQRHASTPRLRRKAKWERARSFRPVRTGPRPSSFRLVHNEAYVFGGGEPRVLKQWHSGGAFTPLGSRGQRPPPEGYDEYHKRCCAWGGESPLSTLGKSVHGGGGGRYGGGSGGGGVGSGSGGGSGNGNKSGGGGNDGSRGSGRGVGNGGDTVGSGNGNNFSEFGGGYNKGSDSGSNGSGKCSVGGNGSSCSSGSVGRSSGNSGWSSDGSGGGVGRSYAAATMGARSVERMDFMEAKVLSMSDLLVKIVQRLEGALGSPLAGPRAP